MPRKSNKKDKQKPQESEQSEGEEMSDAMSIVEEDIEEEEAGETYNSGKKTSKDIMLCKAITSLKSGLYKKINK